MSFDRLLVTKTKPPLYFKRKIHIPGDYETLIPKESFISPKYKNEVREKPKMKSVICAVNKPSRRSRSSSVQERSRSRSGHRKTARNHEKDKEEDLQWKHDELGNPIEHAEKENVDIKSNRIVSYERRDFPPKPRARTYSAANGEAHDPFYNTVSVHLFVCPGDLLTPRVFF